MTLGISPLTSSLANSIFSLDLLSREDMEFACEDMSEEMA